MDSHKTFQHPVTYKAKRGALLEMCFRIVVSKSQSKHLVPTLYNHCQIHCVGVSRI